MAQLTIHVLDVAHGCSADGLTVEVSRRTPNGELPCASACTLPSGRSAAPLLQNDDFPAGEYTLHFYVGAYFAKMNVAASTPPFLSVIRVDIGVSDAQENYHIPLLITPWSYSVYRGS